MESYRKQPMVGVLLTLFRMGGGQKGPPTSFSTVTSRNVGISLQNYLNFIFNPFVTLAQNSSLYLVPIPTSWTWSKTNLQKKRFFWSNPFKIEVFITSLREVLELPNFVHMTTSTIWFELCDEILLVTSWTKFMMS